MKPTLSIQQVLGSLERLTVIFIQIKTWKCSCLYMLLLPFHIYLGLFWILFLWRWWFHIALVFLQSEVILSISLIPVSPVILSSNPVVVELLLSSFSKPVSYPPVGGHIIIRSTDSGSSFWILFRGSDVKWCSVRFP